MANVRLVRVCTMWYGPSFALAPGNGPGALQATGVINVPPLPVITNGWQVAQQWTSTDELHDMYNVIAVLSGDTATASQVAEQVAHAFATAILPVVRHGLAMGITRVTKLDGTSLIEDFTTAHTGDLGGVTTGNGLPLELAKLITLRSNTRGRSHRGRIYIPGASDAELVNEFTRALTSTALTALTTAASDFPAAILDNAIIPLALQVLSRKLGSMIQVQEATPNTGMVNQRRRFEKVAHR